MTDEQWKLMEELVSVPYGRATLKADEYNIDTLCLPDKPLKYILMVYVNGKVKTYTMQFGNLGRNVVRAKSVEFVFNTLNDLLEK